MGGGGIINERGTHTRIHGLASTSRMRTAILPGQWQPWTAVCSYWGSSAWHSRRVNPCLKDPFLPRGVQSALLSTNSTQYMWELLDGMREVLARPWVGVCLPFALSLSYVYDVFIILHCNSFLSFFFFFFFQFVTQLQCKSAINC